MEQSYGQLRESVSSAASRFASMAKMPVVLCLLMLSQSQQASVAQDGSHPLRGSQNREGQAVHSKTVSVRALGGQLSVRLPDGYCSIKDKGREGEMLKHSRDMMPQSVRILHAAAECSELAKYAAGNSDEVFHWLQVQMIGPSGTFRRLPFSREEFLSNIGGQLPEIDFTAIESEAETLLERAGMDVSSVKQAPIGRDGNAIYMATNFSVENAAAPRHIRGLGAITLVNSIPLGIHVYSSKPLSDSPRDLQSDLHSLLQSILHNN
ncbi:hypothetical protein G4Y73_01355 [Wenzhouxiangella sp. XN201]|uniref:hypothetical protein n=1 Tax=Wenzhouxiangella sp. XN201 TaxID=2710755 RepID=UPI0013CDB428|nr:hypothetical protein [Wenzhouxiangella sp. XN201]NEZ02793.1 hypothetical protein [Wenzhouxiangella sp. XN201]